MNEIEKSDATDVDLKLWRGYVDSLAVSPLFVTVSGAHIYGFPSPDSDIDLRGCHQVKLRQLLGLSKPAETFQHDGFHKGIEVDLVSHDVGKYFSLLVKNNGYILEQVFSPLVVSGEAFLEQLRPLAAACITRNHVHHYRGFFATQLKLIQKQQPATAKAVLYAYRVLCTGIHLMKTGEVQSDLRILANEMQLSYIDELIAAKVSEKAEFKFDVDWHVDNLRQLENQMLEAASQSVLQEKPNRDRVSEFLVKIRLDRTDTGK